MTVGKKIAKFPGAERFRLYVSSHSGVLIAEKSFHDEVAYEILDPHEQTWWQRFLCMIMLTTSFLRRVASPGVDCVTRDILFERAVIYGQWYHQYHQQASGGRVVIYELQSFPQRMKLVWASS